MPLFEVKKIKLYKMGVGWISASSSFPDKEVIIPILAKNQDDFLKTFHVNILGNAKLLSVSFDSGTRSEMKLSYDGDALLSLLELLVGSKIQIVFNNGNNLEGYLAGYQIYNETEDSNVSKELVEIVLVDEANKVHTINSKEIASILPESDYIQKMMKDELELLSKSKKEEQKNIRLIFDKEIEKTVEVSYLAEMPAWQSTYKLFIFDKEAVLELWAIVNNITPHDWIDAELELVTGKPISFRYDLSTPWFIERPTVERPEQEQFQIESPEIEYLEAEKSHEPKPLASRAMKRVRAAKMRAAPASAPYSPQQALESAEVVEGAETISFKIKEPVNVKKGEASILLLSSVKVPAKNMTIYNKDRHITHPFKAVEIENTTSFAWEEGPVTVYSAEGYLGEAMTKRVPKNAKQLITYMLEQDITIREDITTKSEKISMSLSGAYYVETYLTRKTYKFEINNRANEETELILEIPKGVFKIDKKELNYDYSTTLNYFRIKVKLEPYSSTTVTVPMFRKDSQNIAISSISDELLEELVKLETLNEKQKTVLNKIKTLRLKIKNKERQLEKEKERYNRLIEENNQITEALQVLSNTGEEAKTRAKFVEKLNNVFEQIEKAKQSIEIAEKEIIKIKKEINELLNTL